LAELIDDRICRLHIEEASDHTPPP
jgi:hypothetical protein